MNEKELVFATNNPNKLREVKPFFAPLSVRLVTLKEAGSSHETEEDGATYYENARKKAYEAAMLFNRPAVADDSGISVDALGGEPGIHSARFAPAGERCNEILRRMEGIKNRRAYLETAVVLVFPDGREISAEYRVAGLITDKKTGENNFGYDKIFYYEETGCTFAEMSMEEKNAVSHRGVAFKRLIEKINDEGITL